MTRSTTFKAHNSNKKRIRLLINRPPPPPSTTPIPRFVSSSGWVQAGLGSVFRKIIKQNVKKRPFAPRRRLCGSRLSSARAGYLVAATTTTTIASHCRGSGVPISPFSSAPPSPVSTVSTLSTLSTLPILSPGSSIPGSPAYSPTLSPLLVVSSLSSVVSGADSFVALGDNVSVRSVGSVGSGFGENDGSREEREEEVEEVEEEEEEEEEAAAAEEEEGVYEESDFEEGDYKEGAYEEDGDMMEIDWRFGDREYMDVDWWEGDMEVDILPPNATSLWF
ncbi:hypothetical protein BDC45DRAFT_342708 [Circinella umbellata]|nr:hypothetical protein BDC45DRAFT_342708 [Circinella umbellata]